jgi:hypothetical protein
MAADAFIQCRVSQATKAALRETAARQHIGESALLKRMMQLGLQSRGAEGVGDIGSTIGRSSREARLSIRLTPGDHQFLRARSAARCLPPATYASVLLRGREVLGHWSEVENALRAEGRVGLADEVGRFMAGMPPKQGDREPRNRVLWVI